MEIETLKNMSIRAFAVIDTNVLISFLKNPESDTAVSNLGKLIEQGNVIPLYDERILSEYYAVLNYSKFGFLPEVIENQMNVILSNGIYVNDVKQLDVHFKDETDIPFYEVMMDTQELASNLVTGNPGHYPVGSYVSPHQLLNNLLYMETFIAPLKTVDYKKAVEEKILKITASDKYYLGKVLPKEFIEKLEERRLNVRERIPLKKYIR